MGDEVIGDVSALHYSAALETPKNEAFVKAYRAKYGKVPSYYSENNYTTAQWIDEAMKQASGKWPGPSSSSRSCRASSSTPCAVRSPWTTCATRSRTSTSRRSRRRRCSATTRTELWNTVIKTYPNVSQFWTYNRRDPVSVVVKEGLPCLRRATSPRYHVLRDCRLGDVEAELQKLAVDMRRTPERVLDAHSSDKVAHLFVDLRSTTERAGFPSPECSEAFAMPTHDRLRP